MAQRADRQEGARRMVDTPVRRSYRALYVTLGIMFVLLVGQLYNMQILQGCEV